MNSFDNLVKQGGGFLALSDGLVPEPTPTSPHIDPIPPSAQYPVDSSLMSSSPAAASSLVNAPMTDEVGIPIQELPPSPIPITPFVTKQDSSSLEQQIQKQQEVLEALLNQQKQLLEQKQKAKENTPDQIGPSTTATTTSDSISSASALAPSALTRGANVSEQHVAPHDGEHPIPSLQDQEQSSPAAPNTTTTTTSDSMSELNTGVTQRDGEHTPTLSEDRTPTLEEDLQHDYTLFNQEQSNTGSTTTNNECSTVTRASEAGSNNQRTVGENGNVALSGEDRSAIQGAIQGRERDIRRQELQRKIDRLHATANTESSQRKLDPPDNHPPSAPPIFYDLYQKKRDLAELSGRCIPPSDVCKVARNYCYAMFNCAQLKFDGGHNGRVRNYTCDYCKLRIRFTRKSSATDEGFVLETSMFPHLLLHRPGHTPHSQLCPSIESKTITDRAIILNHPFFFQCFQKYLPLNTIAAIHMKTGKIVSDIQTMFETGEGNQRNYTDLKRVSWHSIVDNMIDILYHKMAREYKMIPRQLIDLITINPKLSVNLNTDPQGRFLRCFVGFPIALHVGTLTLPILIADCFFIELLRLMGWFLISVPRLHTVIQSYYVLPFCRLKKPGI